MTLLDFGRLFGARAMISERFDDGRGYGRYECHVFKVRGGNFCGFGSVLHLPDKG